MATKILLVSDDKKFDEKLNSHIKDHTFSLIHEKSGSSAISKIKSSKPDMVMIDLSVPKRDGWEILDEMQKSKSLSKIPAVVVDERNSHTHEMEAFERGAASYASKALQAELLLQKAILDTNAVIHSIQKTITQD